MQRSDGHQHAEILAVWDLRQQLLVHILIHTYVANIDVCGVCKSTVNEGIPFPQLNPLLVFSLHMPPLETQFEGILGVVCALLVVLDTDALLLGYSATPDRVLAIARANIIDHRVSLQPGRRGQVLEHESTAISRDLAIQIAVDVVDTLQCRKPAPRPAALLVFRELLRFRRSRHWLSRSTRCRGVVHGQSRHRLSKGHASLPHL
mmetsp:Transcript_870/g.2321  ORF Transcript_870/g.2321 Transcript_870/m.2321 type:complete len:205 (-) Transcript_870:38-652(-)